MLLAISANYMFEFVEARECPDVCAELWAPICAENAEGKLQTFPNICDYQIYGCEHGISEG